jgi:hypothetical protein
MDCVPAAQVHDALDVKLKVTVPLAVVFPLNVPLSMALGHMLPLAAVENEPFEIGVVPVIVTMPDPQFGADHP